MSGGRSAQFSTAPVRWSSYRDCTMDGAPGEGEAQGRELASWLVSADASAAARSDLLRRALPHGADQVDDLLGEVAAKVLTRIADTPLDLRAGTTVAAYARRTLANAVTDLARGHHDLSFDALLEAGAIGVDSPVGRPGPGPGPGRSDVDEFDVVLDRDDRDLCGLVRRSLHGGLGERYALAWVVAAALVVVALSQDDLPVAAGVPRPDAAHGGAGQAQLWAALAYAGQDRCFEQPDSSAVRQRRSVAMGHVSAALLRAHAVAVSPDQPIEPVRPGGRR